MTSSRHLTQAVITISAAALVAHPQPAQADTAPSWQHPRPDPTAGCVLLPDPGSSGDRLYPAGNDTAAGAANTPVQVPALANDCANNSPGTDRSWDLRPPVTPADQAAGDFTRPVGQLSADDTTITFLPNPGWSGTAVFTYGWVESGTEDDTAWHGSYTARASTYARVTITIAAAPSSPPPSSYPPTPTPAPTPTATATAIGIPSSRTPAPHRTARTPTPTPAAVAAVELANTGTTPTTALGLAVLLLLAGGGAAAAGDRRRWHAGTHRAERAGRRG